MIRPSRANDHALVLPAVVLRLRVERLAGEQADGGVVRAEAGDGVVDEPLVLEADDVRRPQVALVLRHLGLVPCRILAKERRLALPSAVLFTMQQVDSDASGKTPSL